MRTLLIVIGVMSIFRATPALSADAETPEAEAIRLAAQHAHRLEVDEPTEEDPVVFTDITPYTTDETPVRLPPDQALQ
jgi:hypothetical protein